MKREPLTKSKGGKAMTAEEKILATIKWKVKNP
jgi:hypothetical protein